MSKVKKVLLIGLILTLLMSSISPVIPGYLTITKAYNHKPSNILENVFESNGLTILPFIFEDSDQTIKKTYILEQFKAAGEKIENESKLKDIIVTGDQIKTASKTYTVLIYGDVNGDGYVDAFDAQRILRHDVYGEEFELTEIYLIAADVKNDDNEVDAFDAQRILKFDVGFETKLVVNEPVSSKEKDKGIPVIKLNGDNPQIIKVGEAYKELGATVTDDIDKNLVPKIDATSVKTNVPGTYYVSYNAVDSNNNKAVEVKRTVIVEDYIKNVEINVDNIKKEYLKGEAIDLTGGKINIKYASGKQETINIENNMISGYDANKAGTQSVTVTYSTSNTIDDKKIDYTKSFEVVVKAKKVTNIKATFDGTEIVEGSTDAETLEKIKSHIIVEATYDDGTKGNLTENDFIVEGTIVVGKTNTITVKYTDGITDTVNVTVKAKSVSSIKATFDGAEILEEATDAETLEKIKSHITVEATYDNGTKGNITNFTVEGTIVAGKTNTITVKYTDKITTTVQVRVKTKSIISIVATCNATEILEGKDNAETLEKIKSHITVKATTNNGTTIDLEQDDFTVSGTIVVGNLNTITVKYVDGITDTVNVTVKAKSVSSIKATFDGTKIVEGADDAETLATIKSHITVEATYDNGTTGNLTENDFTVEGTIVAGKTNTITVKYTDKITTTVQVTVQKNSTVNEILLYNTDGNTLTNNSNITVKTGELQILPITFKNEKGELIDVTEKDENGNNRITLIPEMGIAPEEDDSIYVTLRDNNENTGTSNPIEKIGIRGINAGIVPLTIKVDNEQITINVTVIETVKNIVLRKENETTPLTKLEISEGEIINLAIDFLNVDGNKIYVSEKDGNNTRITVTPEQKEQIEAGDKLQVLLQDKDDNSGTNAPIEKVYLQGGIPGTENLTIKVDEAQVTLPITITEKKKTLVVVDNATVGSGNEVEIEGTTSINLYEAKYTIRDEDNQDGMILPVGTTLRYTLVPIRIKEGTTIRELESSELSSIKIGIEGMTAEEASKLIRIVGVQEDKQTTGSSEAACYVGIALTPNVKTDAQRAAIEKGITLTYEETGKKPVSINLGATVKRDETKVYDIVLRKENEATPLTKLDIIEGEIIKLEVDFLNVNGNKIEVSEKDGNNTRITVTPAQKEQIEAGDKLQVLLQDKDEASGTNNSIEKVYLQGGIPGTENLTIKVDEAQVTLPITITEKKKTLVVVDNATVGSGNEVEIEGTTNIKLYEAKSTIKDEDNQDGMILPVGTTLRYTLVPIRIKEGKTIRELESSELSSIKIGIEGMTAEEASKLIRIIGVQEDKQTTGSAEAACYVGIALTPNVTTDAQKIAIEKGITLTYEEAGKEPVILKLGTTIVGTQGN